MTVCTHMCRGNFRSSWVAEGGYDHVAEALFGELAVDGFFLEYDDARSGGFEPLRFVPKGNKRVVLGLVTSKRAALESKDELKRRIDEAAKYVPLDQLCLSPQCGFSSTVDGNALTRGRADRQAAPRRRNRPRGLGLTARKPLRCASWGNRILARPSCCRAGSTSGLGEAFYGCFIGLDCRSPKPRCALSTTTAASAPRKRSARISA